MEHNSIHLRRKLSKGLVTSEDDQMIISLNTQDVELRKSKESPFISPSSPSVPSKSPALKVLAKVFSFHGIPNHSGTKSYSPDMKKNRRSLK